MLPMGDHEKLADPLTPDERGEGARLPPGAERAEPAEVDLLAAGASGTHVHEEMAKPRLGARDPRREPAVVRKAEARKPSPFEATHAEDEAARESLPEQPDAEALSRFAARENEDRVGLSPEHSVG